MLDGGEVSGRTMARSNRLRFATVVLPHRELSEWVVTIIISGQLQHLHDENHQIDGKPIFVIDRDQITIPE